RDWKIPLQAGQFERQRGGCRLLGLGFRLAHVLRPGRRRRIGKLNATVLVHPTVLLCLGKPGEQQQGDQKKPGNHMGILPLCLRSAFTLGSRPRKARNDSAAGRLPPTARISSWNRRPASGFSTPFSSNRLYASAERTSA